MFVTDSIKVSDKDIYNHYFNKKSFERLTNTKASKKAGRTMKKEFKRYLIGYFHNPPCVNPKPPTLGGGFFIRKPK